MPPKSQNRHVDLPIHSPDQSDILDMYTRLSGRAKLIAPDGRSHNLPTSIHAFLHQLLADLAAGKAVSIIQSGAALTTVEAAKLLGVSRQFLVNLLEAGELPFHKVGTHRRIYARDVLAYKHRRDIARRKALDDLVTAEVEEGLYDLGPDDISAGH